MISHLWNVLFEHLKGSPYWKRLAPFVALISAYVITNFLAIQYFEWQYNISSDMALYLHSNAFKKITVVYAAVVTAMLLTSLIIRSPKTKERSRLLQSVVKFSRMAWKRAVVLLIVALIAVPIYIHFSSVRATHITIKFFGEPDFNEYAFLYLIYELNKLQKDWYFEVDFSTYRIESYDCEGCPRNQAFLCYAESITEGPLIAITADQFEKDFFWQNRGSVSVISTFAWEIFAPPSIYEYLLYSVVTQSILIHLNHQCTGLPEGSFDKSRTTYGDLFQFLPRRNLIKAHILASQLSEKGKELLLNCFGIQYVRDCVEALRLDWLRSDRIKHNLATSFRIQI